MTPVSSCPRCGAHVRAGAQWCTLCFTDLRSAPVPPGPVEPELIEPELIEPELIEPELATVPESAGTGKHARRSSSSSDDGADPTDDTRAAGTDPALRADAMLARLAAETSDPLAGLTGRFESKGSGIGLTVGGVVVIGAVLLLLMVLIGSLL